MDKFETLFNVNLDYLENFGFLHHLEYLSDCFEWDNEYDRSDLLDAIIKIFDTVNLKNGYRTILDQEYMFAHRFKDFDKCFSTDIDGIRFLLWYAQFLGTVEGLKLEGLCSSMFLQFKKFLVSSDGEEAELSYFEKLEEKGL